MEARTPKLSDPVSIASAAPGCRAVYIHGRRQETRPGSFQNPFRPGGYEIPDDYVYITVAANIASLDVCGHPATCVLTSHALQHYLRGAGYDADLVRVTAAVFPEEGSGVILGSDGGGKRRPKAAPGNWRGHLAVASEGYLLDATLPQVNTAEIEVGPMIIPLPPEWETGQAQYLETQDKTLIKYTRYHSQRGWKSAPDARPSHWHGVYAAMDRMLVDTGED